MKKTGEKSFVQIGKHVSTQRLNSASRRTTNLLLLSEIKLDMHFWPSSNLGKWWTSTDNYYWIRDQTLLGSKPCAAITRRTLCCWHGWQRWPNATRCASKIWSHIQIARRCNTALRQWPCPWHTIAACSRLSRRSATRIWTQPIRWARDLI